METFCVRHTDLPGASRLFTDLIYHFDKVAAFYDYAPYETDSFAKAAAAISFPAERRAALVAALAEQNPGNPMLERLAQPGTVAVVSGQQVGLHGGPLYTILKALTAVRLSETLTEQGIVAVPVFWLATEDHDLEEINQAWLFDGQGKPAVVRTAAVNPGPGPVGPIPIAEAGLTEIRALLAGQPFAEEAMALAETAYGGAGATFGSAFARLMQLVLGRFNLLFLDPLAPAIRRLGAPLLRQALEQVPSLTEALLARNQQLESAGYHAQVHVEATGTQLFLLEGGRRVALRRTADGFTTDGKGPTLDAAALAAQAENLSPNAILRPVMQDFMLPTVAYVGGPAELAYFAQSQVLYHQLLGRMPVVLHRASFTLLDPKVKKLMDRYHLSLRDIFTYEAELRERMAAKLLPPELAGKFAALRESVQRTLAGLDAELAAVEPGLHNSVARMKAKVLYQLGRMEAKAARELQRKDEVALRHVTLLHEALYPHRHPQERLYGVLPFLARYGLGLVDDLYANIRTECPDHQVALL